MEIKLVEELTGLTRANIRFYEREGLIAPLRQGNGYRDYSEADVDTLLRIRLLRSLRVSLDEIRLLQMGERELSSTLLRQIGLLEKEQREAAYARELCQAMRADKVNYATLDARKYLERAAVEATASGYFSMPNDVPEVFPIPWRRNFARNFDFVLYGIICLLVIGLVFNVNIVEMAYIYDVLIAILSMLMMLFIEPLLLSKWGTTPGKALLGIYVEDAHGNRLSYSQGIERTFGALLWGLGLNIPIFGIVRSVISYRACSERRPLPWEKDGNTCQLRDAKAWRTVAYLLSITLFYFLLLTVSYVQQLPPNRGELSVAQFAENYNYYAQYYDLEHPNYYLGEDGKWAWAERPGYSYYKALDNRPLPEYSYELEGDYLRAVQLVVDAGGADQQLGSNSTAMILAALALAGASPEKKLYSDELGDIALRIQHRWYTVYSFEELGCNFLINCNYSGYVAEDSKFIPDSGAAEYSYHLEFSARKME